jgi:hypothetical protein
MRVRTSLTTLSATAVLLASAATATAATQPLSAPHITNHFQLAASQQPENITVDRTGAAYLTFSFARQIVRVTPGSRPHVMATLPAPAKANTPNLGKAFVGGIARADDGTLYVTYATGTADLTGVWVLRPGGRPHRIAALPADGLPNGLALDQHTDKLYVTDSVHGVIYRLPACGGQATVWAKGTQLEPTTFAGANGLKLHNGSVWATNLDRGTVLRIPVTAKGTAGTTCPPSTQSSPRWARWQPSAPSRTARTFRCATPNTYYCTTRRLTCRFQTTQPPSSPAPQPEWVPRSPSALPSADSPSTPWPATRSA